MDRRFLTVMGVSLVFALVVSSVFYSMTSRAGSTKKTEVTDMKDVVVATRPLSVGAMIKPADIKLEKVSSGSFPKGAFSKVEDVLDRPVVSNVLLDEPVLEGRLATKGSGLGLAPTIPVGMRAVTVRVNDVAGVAGFVLPGMHVDVLVTGKPPFSDNDMTATALQNVLVLSSGQVLQPDARGQPIQSPTVTLLVSPQDAETLTLAGNDGRVQLILRNSSDGALEKTSGRQIQELYNGGHPTPPAKTGSGVKAPPKPVVAPQVVVAPPPVVVPALPPVIPPHQIVMIRGTQKSVETVPDAEASN